MGTRFRTLGILSIALLLGVSSSFAGELSNVTLGRFQDFTVVTLFGDGPMSVTHQIVEAKDGKPHRIVVDITGALHKLPQNNFPNLPEGSITTIRTSQFAVSPEPVVRVVLDLTHPAAYRLETPDNQVRVMVSLPGDPPLAKVWSARDGGIQAEPFQSSVTYADAGATQASEGLAIPAPESSAVDAEALAQAGTEPVAQDESTAGMDPAAVPSTEIETRATTPENAEGNSAPSSEPAQPKGEQSSPTWDNPAKSVEPEGVIKSLPLAPTGAMATTGTEGATEAAPQKVASQESQSQEITPIETSASEPAFADAAPESEDMTAASPASEGVTTPEASTASVGQAEEPSSSAVDHPEMTTSPAATAEGAHESSMEQTSEALALDDESEGPQVPMPEQAINQPERVIDYNLPIPAALAEGAASDHALDSETNSEPQAESESAPKLAVKSPQADEKGEPAQAQAAPAGEASAQTGSDAAVTDAGSAPLASLTTLPPLSESAADLVPQRTQVIYHTQGRRDPFKALLQSGGYNAAALPDVSSLRLVGLLHDVQEAWGLFEDANGYGYILKKGDRVKSGSLTQLTNNRAYFSITEFGWSRSVHIDLEPEG